MSFLEHKFGRVQNRCMWQTLECLSNCIFPKNGKLVDETCSPMWKEPLHEYFELMMLTWFSFVRFLKNVFSNSYEILLVENLEILQFWKNKKKEWRDRLFWKKPLSSFQKASSTKMEGANYPGGSRVAFLICLSYPLHSICVGLIAILVVLILQMHCQTELRWLPCSVSSCFNPEIATTFGTEKFFFLWVPWFNVRLQRVWRASSIPHFLPFSKSFSVMTFSTCSLSLDWLKSERNFFLTSWTEFGSWGIFWFFCVIFFRLFLKGKSSSRRSAFFSWWLPIAFMPTLAFLFTSEPGFTFSQNCSILP